MLHIPDLFKQQGTKRKFYFLLKVLCTTGGMTVFFSCVLQLIPNWCNAIYSGDVDLRVYILEQFIHIVGVAKQHMRKFLDRIMQMLLHLWSDDCPKKTLISVLRLVGELAGMFERSSTNHRIH